MGSVELLRVPHQRLRLALEIAHVERVVRRAYAKTAVYPCQIVLRNGDELVVMLGRDCTRLELVEEARRFVLNNDVDLAILLVEGLSCVEPGKDVRTEGQRVAFMLVEERGRPQLIWQAEFSESQLSEFELVEAEHSDIPRLFPRQTSN